MGSDRIRVSKRRLFGYAAPTGQLVLPHNVSNQAGAGVEALPPFDLNGRLYLGTIATGVANNNASNPPRAPTAVLAAALGQTPITAAVQNGVYGLAGPMRRPAIVRSAAWSSSLGTFWVSGGPTRHLVRLDSDGSLVRAAAGAGTATDTVTPAYALPAWNRVVFAQGAADALITFTIGTDQTATYAADVAVPFGATPGGIGAVVQNAAGTKALAFGRDLQNRNQIAQSTDGAAWAALTETPISAGNPLRVADALALPAANGNPAVMLALCTLGGASGPVRLLRTADDAGSFALISVTSSASAASACELAYVNGILFIFTAAGWFYSVDHGATIRVGPSQVVNPGRVDWDAALQCYVVHLRMGGIAILTESGPTRDLAFIGSLLLPQSEQLLSQAIASIGTYIGYLGYAIGTVTCATYYRAGTLYGVAAVRQGGGEMMATLTYAWPLAMMRLPKGEAARVLLKAGGGYGELYYSAPSTLTVLPNNTTSYPRIPAGPTRLLGVATATGGGSLVDGSVAAGEVRFFSNAGSPPASVAVSGGAGIVIDGVSLGAGGARQQDITGWLPGGFYEACAVGGSAGGEARVQTSPGALLVFEIGAGGRVERRLIGNLASGGSLATLLTSLSTGQPGGALVEWEEWQ